MNSVSVIIAARNEAANLQVHLPLILQQNHPEFEVVVVNDRSSDDSSQFLAEWALKYNHLKIVSIETLPEGITGKKHALIKGIEAAKYETLLFTDADCKPCSPDWISKMTQNMSHDQYNLVLGISQYQNEGSFSLLNEFIQFETLVTAVSYMTFAKLGIPYMGVGRNLAYKKALFTNNQGFDRHKEIVGGDDDLFVGEVAKEAKVGLISTYEGQTISLSSDSWKNWFQQKRRHLSVGRSYSLFHKLIVGFWQQFVLWSYIALFVVCFLAFPDKNLYLIALGVVRFFYWGYLWTCKRRWNFKMRGLLFPFYDFLYVIYFLVAGISVILVKNNKWK